MGRKKDTHLIQLENQVKMIEANLAGNIQVQESILAVYKEHLVKMRDLLTKLIEGR